MKYLRFICVFSLLVLSCSDSKTDEPTIQPGPGPVGGGGTLELKVMNYNIRFGELTTLEDLAAFILEQDPDVVALQEVDCRTLRPAAPLQNGVDIVTTLGYLTGMFSAYGKAMPYYSGYYGIGILSKYPLSSVDRVYLPVPPGCKEQRALLVADVEYDDDKYFTFACTHLDNSTTEVRQVQVAKLNEVLHNQRYPVVFGGDFNARFGSKEIYEDMGLWKKMCNMDFTVPYVPSDPFNPEYLPTSKIDYIFCYPSVKWELVKTVDYDLGDVRYSDHVPVCSIVEMKN